VKARPLGTDPITEIHGVRMPSKLSSGKRRPMEEILAAKGLLDEKAGSEGNKPADDQGGLANETDIDSTAETVEVEISLIRPGKYQPRRIFDQEKLEELADSIAAAGQLTNPVTIRPVEDGLFELVTGERRWRAHQILGWATIKAHVRDLSDHAAQIIALTDNTDAEPLTAYEEARALQDLLDNKVATSNSDLARKTGRAKMTIGRQLSFFSLPKQVVAMLDVNPRLLSQRAAAELVPFCEAHPQVVIDAVEAIDAGKLEVSRAGAWVKNCIRLAERTTRSVTQRNRTVTFTNQSSGLTKAKISGKKIILECSASSDPSKVLEDLAVALGITLPNGSGDAADAAELNEVK
jgi:ParB family chromosome partitioning protein